MIQQTSECFAGAVDPKELGDARLYAHYALQWLARLSRAYLPIQPDDSHTALKWIPSDNVFLTQSLDNGYSFGLILSQLTLFCSGRQNYYEEFPLDGCTDAEIGLWVKNIISDLKLDEHCFQEKLPYNVPYHHLTNDGTYDGIDTAMGLRELSLWYNYAHTMLHLIKEQHVGQSRVISEIQCWPHHFDMSIIVDFEGDHSSQNFSISLGLSPGDDYYNEPYFYATPWPYLKPRMLPELPFIGHWHVKGFVGAVALSSRLCELDTRDKMLIAFLKNAIEIGRNRT